MVGRRRASLPVALVATALATGCGDGPTEIALRLLSSRLVPLARLELFVTLDDESEPPPVALTEGGAAPSLPGGALLRVPRGSQLARVRVVAKAMDGAMRSALDSVRPLAGQRVDLPLRLEFGDAGPDGGPLEGLPLGAPCAVAADCTSGFCADGVCCDQACDAGDCDACAVAAGAVTDGLCGPKRAGTVCRPALGACDVAEQCDGTSPACPADARVAASTPCRASVGACDLAEACDGAAPECPADQSSCAAGSYCAGMSCVPQRAAGSPCQQDKECASGFCTDGRCCKTRCQGGACDSCAVDSTGTCTMLGPSTVCRAAVGPCDAAESCDGANPTCPADQLAPATTVCRAAVDVCDASETCTGQSALCPALDKYKIAGTVCRGLGANPCDRAESCTGASPACPADAVAPTLNARYETAGGQDGFTGMCNGSGPGGLGYQRVEAICNESAPDCFTRGFVSWGTENLPDNAVVLSSKVRVCMTGGPGAQSAELYSTTFSLPLSDSAFNQPVTLLRDFPGGFGFTDVTLPTSAIKTAAPTQLQLRWPVTSCQGQGWSGRAYASSQSNPANHPDCPLGGGETLAWVLSLSYCVP